MLINPSVRIQGNENTVWQRMTSDDNYTFDIGARPTEMFMKFNDREFFTHDGSTLTISNLGSALDPSLEIDGYMNLNERSGVVPGIFVYDSTPTYQGGIYYATSAVNIDATNKLYLRSSGNDIRLFGVSTDNTEDYVVAIDNSSGKLSKRAVNTIGGISSASVTLSASDIINGTVVELVAAPGAGNFINVINAVAAYNYGSSFYTGTDGDIALHYGAGSSYFRLGTNLNLQANSYFGQLTLHSNSFTMQKSTYTNAALGVGLINSSLANGDGTITVKVYYTVESI